MSRIVVVGVGYVGLATAVCFAHLGHEVSGVDTDSLRIAQLRDGKPPFFEHGMDKILREGLMTGRLSFSRPDEIDYYKADFVFLCVPTPPRPDGSADLSAIKAAARRIGPQLRPGAIVVNKSTVPVGTARRVATWLGRSDIHVASNPEFLQEGTAISAFLNSERVVIGADDPAVASSLAELYATTSTRQIVTSIESAELAKYACNSFLATKLTFVNSLVGLCELTSADITEVISVMGADSRIGDKFLRPGPGWGGSCFPKDIRALIATADSAGIELPLLRAVLAANNDAFELVAAQLTDLCNGTLAGRRIAAWGLTFKAGTDDVRDSPAIEVIRRLIAAGADVIAYDPMVHSHPLVATAPDAYTAVSGADALVVLTEWPEFNSVDLHLISSLMATPSVLDTRNVLDPASALRAGLIYRVPGQPPRNPCVGLAD